MPEYYKIKVKGHLDSRWADWFTGITLTHLDGAETLLAGWLEDQAALHSLLERIRDLNLKLISVTGEDGIHINKEQRMKVLVISYSNTGNNEALASRIANTLGSEHVRITEKKSRKMGKIVMDQLMNRTPKVTLPDVHTDNVDLVLFVGPVWLGKVASPFRACFKKLRQDLGDYAFVSIDGGADGPNPNLSDELTEKLGKAPTFLLELHLADLLPADPQPTRDDTMGYHITEAEAAQMADTVVTSLRQAVAG